MFYMIFEKIYFSCNTLLTDQLCLVASALWDIGQYVYCDCFFTRWRHNMILKLTLYFSWSCFFYMTEKSRLTFKYLENKKSFKMNKKHFSLLLKGRTFTEANKAIFLGGESPTLRWLQDNLTITNYKFVIWHSLDLKITCCSQTLKTSSQDNSLPLKDSYETS